VLHALVGKFAFGRLDGARQFPTLRNTNDPAFPANTDLIQGIHDCANAIWARSPRHEPFATWGRPQDASDITMAVSVD
jgi:hypothetical protein